MRIAVTGSIATDHLMTFDGRFADNLIEGRLERVSLSFLVSTLTIRRGGVAANIAFGLGVLGLRPLLVGAVGEDFHDYRVWLEDHGVDCSGVRVSTSAHTARFLCTTDQDQAQISSFYPGAMSEAREIDLLTVSAGSPLDLVVISPNDPEAMTRHTRQCRERGIPFVADPSQQLSWADGDQIRDLVDGASHLFSNDYEAALLEEKTGWSPAEVLARVGTRITTRGEDGVLLEGENVGGHGVHRVDVPVVPASRVADPTGVGDAFRAGYLAGFAQGLTPTRCAQLGATVATHVVETVGTQEYRIDREFLLRRIASVYGSESEQAIGARLVPMDRAPV